MLTSYYLVIQYLGNMTSQPAILKDEHLIRELLKSKYLIDNDDYPVFTPLKLTSSSLIQYSPVQSCSLFDANYLNASIDTSRMTLSSTKYRHSKPVIERIYERMQKSVNRGDGSIIKVVLADETDTVNRAIEDSQRIRSQKNTDIQMKHTLKEISLMKCSKPNNILKITASKNPTGYASLALNMEKRRPSTTPMKNRPLTTQSIRRQSANSVSHARRKQNTIGDYRAFLKPFKPNHNKNNSVSPRSTDQLNIEDMLKHSILKYNYKQPEKLHILRTPPKYPHKHNKLNINIIDCDLKKTSSKESYEDLSTSRYTGLSPWRVETTATPSAAGSSQHFVFNSLKLNQISGKPKTTSNSLSLMNSKILKSKPCNVISLETKRAKQFEEAKLLESFQNGMMLQPQDTSNSSSTDKKYSTVSISTIKPAKF